MMKYSPDFSSRFRILKGGKISLVVSALLAGTTMSFAAPTGGTVTTGTATINQSGSITTINQSTNKASINWNSFSIAPHETVNFVQPSAQSITLNRVIGTTQSLIQGAMNANGHVFLINPNGVLFANGAQINVGGLVASTLNITDENFQAGNYVFEGNSQNSVLNMGTITANNGYVAMMGQTVQNGGTIVATMGNVQMASGEKISLNLNGNSLVKLTIDQGTMDALVENKGLIKADGGQVYLTTQALNTILDGMVNNTGIIEAQTLGDVTGKVVLYAHGGTANISGTVDASGGFIETSGKALSVANGTTIKAKTWLIDPVNVTIDNSVDAIGGATVGASVIETALSSGGGNTDVIITADNDITVNEALDWSTNKLTLSAGNNIAVNADMTATGMASLAFEYGQATANGGTSRYTVADGIDVLIPNASAFTWKKGSGGAVTNLVLDNGYLRFGDGTEASINNMGSLLAPSYYDNTNGRNGWYQLTFAPGNGYPLDFMIGVNGSSYNDGSLYDTAGETNDLASAVSNLSINISKYFEKTGTVTASMNVATTAGVLPVTQSYTLDSGSNFIKAITSLSNTTGSAISNARLWIGTQDDYVATLDSNYKTRGNISGNGFEAVANQSSDEAKALIVSENQLDSGNGAAVLFYSTTNGTNAIVGQAFGWNYIVNANPSNISNYSTTPRDSSYALYLNLGTFPDQATGSVTWYYAAAPVSELGNMVNQVGQSAGVTPSTPSIPSIPSTPSTPSTEQQTQVNNVVTTIVNSTTVTPPAPIVVAPVVPQQQVQTQAQNNTLLQSILPQGTTSEGGSFALVGSTDGSSPVQTVTMEQLQTAATTQGMGEIRVPLANNSLVELVNGGLNLPSGVTQEFYVVDNSANSGRAQNVGQDDQDKKAKKN
jgi:filamentous hemagglutinin family protein